MRCLLALLLLSLPAIAERESIASRFPAGASAYVEARGLAKKLDAVYDSGLGKAIRAHPALHQFLGSPEGKKLLFGQEMVRGATGMDFRGVLRAVAGREIAAAIYGQPQRFVAMARIEPAAAERLFGGLQLLAQVEREEVIAKDEQGPAVWRIGPVLVVQDGDLVAVSPDRELILAVRGRTAKGVAPPETLDGARALVGTASDLFAYVDLKPFHAQMRKDGKPKDFGQALFLGSFAYYIPEAPWAALGIDLTPQGDAWKLTAHGHVPMPDEPSEPVRTAFGGTLEGLPFALPENTITLVRMRRSLESVWSHRDALIHEEGIPGLVQFETNFGNLTGGMSWVEEFLPNLGNEFIVLGTRKDYKEGEATPAVRIPQGAVLWPIKDAKKLGPKLEVAFQTGIGIINATQAQMMGNAFLIRTQEYKGTTIQSARYLPPNEGEMEGRKALPLRYNFTPSVAIVGDYFVMASTADIVKEIVDSYGKPTPPPAGVNAGFWIMPEQVRESLRENREWLVSQAMLNQGVDRKAAEQQIDWALDLSRYVHGFSLTAQESRASVGLALELVLGPAGE